MFISEIAAFCDGICVCCLFIYFFNLKTKNKQTLIKGGKSAVSNAHPHLYKSAFSTEMQRWTEF